MTLVCMKADECICQHILCQCNVKSAEFMQPGIFLAVACKI